VIILDYALTPLDEAQLAEVCSSPTLEGKVFYTEYVGNGQFRNTQAIETGQYVIEVRPSVTVDATNAANLVFSLLAYENEFTYWTRLGASGWAPPERISDEAGHSWLSRSGLDPLGNLHVVSWQWLAGDPRGDLAYRQWNRIEWGPIQRLETNHEQGYPDICCDLEGNVHVAWDEYDPESDTYVIKWAVKLRTEPGIRIYTNQYGYREGDELRVAVERKNPGSAVRVDQFVLLDVYGVLFWWTNWGPEPMGTSRWMEESSTQGEMILSLTLPSPLGAGGPFFLHAALCTEGTYDLVGDFSSTAFVFLD